MTPLNEGGRQALPRGGQIPAGRRVPPKNPASSSPPDVREQRPAVVPPPGRPPHREQCIDLSQSDKNCPTGSVRICPHGLVQEIYEAPHEGRYWKYISPLLNPLRHYRACAWLIDAGVARSL